MIDEKGKQLIKVITYAYPDHRANAAHGIQLIGYSLDEEASDVFGEGGYQGLVNDEIVLKSNRGQEQRITVAPGWLWREVGYMEKVTLETLEEQRRLRREASARPSPLP